MYERRIFTVINNGLFRYWSCVPINTYRPRDSRQIFATFGNETVRCQIDRRYRNASFIRRWLFHLVDNQDGLIGDK